MCPKQLNLLPPEPVTDDELRRAWATVPSPCSARFERVIQFEPLRRCLARVVMLQRRRVKHG